MGFEGLGLLEMKEEGRRKKKEGCVWEERKGRKICWMEEKMKRERNEGKRYED